MPSFTNLPIAMVLLAFGLHLLGERRAAIKTGRPRGSLARRRALLFYAGLVSILVALVGPIDSLAPKLFWVHMLQHVLLLSVAASEPGPSITPAASCWSARAESPPGRLGSCA